MLPTAMSGLGHDRDRRNIFAAGRRCPAPDSVARARAQPAPSWRSASSGPATTAFGVHDKPGVLGQLMTSSAPTTSEFARSCKTPGHRDEPVWVVVVTHEARERDVRAAIAEIDHLDVVRQPARLIRSPARSRGMTARRRWPVRTLATVCCPRGPRDLRRHHQMASSTTPTTCATFEGARADYWRGPGPELPDLVAWGVALPVVEAHFTIEPRATRTLRHRRLGQRGARRVACGSPTASSAASCSRRQHPHGRDRPDGRPRALPLSCATRFRRPAAG